MKDKFVILDVETTGLHIPQDKIIKVSLLKYNTDTSIEKMTEFINPGQHIPETTTAINGIKDEDVSDAKYFFELADQFTEFIDGAVLVGYSIKKFDLPMFVQEFHSASKVLDLSAGVIDLREIFMTREPRNLDGACSFYGKKNITKYTDMEKMFEVFTGQLEKYWDKDTSFTAIIDEYTDKTIVDLAGKLYRDPNTKQLFFGFGKYNKKSLKYVEENDPSYISWMLSSEYFPEDTKEVLKKNSNVSL